MDLVRQFYAALNANDASALDRLYDANCVVEQVWIGRRDTLQGIDSVGAAWRDEIDRYSGLLPGGHRFDVTRVAGIETGWGWVRAEWVRSVAGRADSAEQHAVGYSHFWIEDGRIRRHRTVAQDVPAIRARDPRPPSERRYPSRPLVGVGAIVLSDAGDVLLVKRKQEPLAGQWSLPGGMLELGETLEAGTAREILEETGLVISVGPVVEVFDRILLDDEAKVRYHFVLIDYLCRVRGGTLAPGSDVEAAEFVAPANVDAYVPTAKARDVVKRALVIR